MPAVTENCLEHAARCHWCGLPETGEHVRHPHLGQAHPSRYSLAISSLSQLSSSG